MNDQELETAVQGRTLVLTDEDILSLIVVLGMANVLFQFVSQKTPGLTEECAEGRVHCGTVFRTVMRQHPDLVEEMYGFQPEFA